MHNNLEMVEYLRFASEAEKKLGRRVSVCTKENQLEVLPPTSTALQL